MSKSNVVPLNLGTGNKHLAQPFGYEVLRSKRKTLAIYISHEKVVVRCPMRASKAEVREFIGNNQQWAA